MTLFLTSTAFCKVEVVYQSLDIQYFDGNEKLKYSSQGIVKRITDEAKKIIISSVLIHINMHELAKLDYEILFQNGAWVRKDKTGKFSPMRLNGSWPFENYQGEVIHGTNTHKTEYKDNNIYQSVFNGRNKLSAMTKTKVKSISEKEYETILKQIKPRKHLVKKPISR